MGTILQMTVEHYAELHGKQTDAVQVKLRRIFPGQKFALDTELTAEHLAALSVDGRRSKRANIARKVLAETSPKIREKLQRYYHTATPEQVVEDMQAIGSDLVDFAPKEKPQPKPAKVRATVAREVLADTPIEVLEKVVRQYAPKRRISIESIRAGMLSVILLAVIIGHGALIWFDCATLWGTAGLIGGGVVFLIVLAAVLLASDETRVRTSGTALYFALCIDIAAWWVHFPTFQRPDVSDIITGSLCAFLCACSWIALFLYRDKNLD